jgi:hypothetical protein
MTDCLLTWLQKARDDHLLLFLPKKIGQSKFTFCGEKSSGCDIYKTYQHLVSTGFLRVIK